VNCCSSDGDLAARAKMARRPRRIATLIRWVLALTTFALIPKCPACIAGYVLVFTGIGVSLPVAAAVRWSLIGVSVASLTCFLFRAVRRASPLPLGGENNARNTR